jgi:hypothetical protein
MDQKLCFYIIIGKTALFKLYPSLEDSARFGGVFTSLYFAAVFFFTEKGLQPWDLEDQVPQ